MKKLFMITILVLIITAVVYYNTEVKTDYNELYKAVDLQVDKCAVDMINNKDIVCD